jgi:alpha-galactosidase
MFRWHKDDPVESAALQILNILFSVPQLSVKLDSVQEDHVNMAGYWMNYWKENRHILLDGDFIPLNPGALYPVILSKGEEKTIVALYDDLVISTDIPVHHSIDIINAKGSDKVILFTNNDLGKRHIIIRDCMGNNVDEFNSSIKKDGNSFRVPPSGMIQILKDK